MGSRLDKLIKSKNELLNSLHSLDDSLLQNIVLISEVIENTILNGNNIFWCGNGGSASQANHLAAEFVGRFISKNRPPLPSISLSSNLATITAIANDFGYEEIFSRQLISLAKKEDILFLLSTSGSSKNICKAIKTASTLNLKTICFFGKNGVERARFCDYSVIIDSDNTARIQEIQMLLGHMICELIDQKFSSGETN